MRDQLQRCTPSNFPFVLLPAHNFPKLNLGAYEQAVERNLSQLFRKQKDLHYLHLALSDPATSEQNRKKALSAFYENCLCLLEQAPRLVVPILREHYVRYQASMDAHYLLFAGLILSRQSNNPKNWPLLRKMAMFIMSSDDAELIRHGTQETLPIMESCRPIREIFPFYQRHAINHQLLLAYASGLSSELRFRELSEAKNTIIRALKGFQTPQALPKPELLEEQLLSQMLPDCFFDKKQLRVSRLEPFFSTSSQIGCSYNLNWPRPYEFDPLHWMSPLMYFANYLLAIKEKAIAKNVINHCHAIIKEKPEIYPKIFLTTLTDWRLLLNQSANSPKKVSVNSLDLDFVGTELSVSDLPQDLGSFKLKLLKIGAVSSKFNAVDASYDFIVKLANFDRASFDFKITIPTQLDLPIVLTILDPITQNQIFFLINQSTDRTKTLVQTSSFLKSLKLSYQTDRLIDAINKFINTKSILKVGAQMEAFNILYSSYQDHALHQSVKEQNLALLNQLCSAVPFNIVDLFNKDLVCFFSKNCSFNTDDLQLKDNKGFFYQLRAINPSQDRWELSLVECFRVASDFHVERIEYRDFQERNLSTLGVVKRLLFDESSED